MIHGVRLPDACWTVARGEDNGHTPSVLGDRSPTDDDGTEAHQRVRTVVLTELGPYAAAWDELVAAQPLPSPFLRSWWLNHAASAEPQIVLCTRADQLIGGAAFEVDRTGTVPVGIQRVRMLGQGVLAPDHLDLIAAEGHHHAVAREVLDWLRRPGQRVIDLDGLTAEGTLARLFAPFVLERVAAPWARTGSDPTAYLADRPGQVRSTVSRSAKRFSRAGATTRVAPPEDADRALAALAELHESRWSDASGFLGAWNRFTAAAKEGMRRREVVVHELVDAEGVVVASQLDLVLGNTAAFYQSGRRTDRDWRGSGSVLRADAIRWASESGATSYDLLRGDEPYKADWATDQRAVLRCRLGVGTFGLAAVRLAAARSAVAARRAARHT